MVMQIARRIVGPSGQTISNSTVFTSVNMCCPARIDLERLEGAK
jgi:hypothetical protein